MPQSAPLPVSTTFRLKLHIVASERQKNVGFVFKSGNLHDITSAEKALRGHQGIVISAKRYFSELLVKRLFSSGLRLIVQPEQNIIPNSEEEKRLLNNARFSQPSSEK
jgi:hypothetical protein